MKYGDKKIQYKLLGKEVPFRRAVLLLLLLIGKISERITGEGGGSDDLENVLASL